MRAPTRPLRAVNYERAKGPFSLWLLQKWHGWLLHTIGVLTDELVLYARRMLTRTAHSTEAGQNYLSINPKGSVPALKLDNGEVLTEAAVIQQYIGDKAPSKKLLPSAGTPEREWLPPREAAL
jgi:glutathione S-transferase